MRNANSDETHINPDWCVQDQPTSQPANQPISQAAIRDFARSARNAAGVGKDR